MLEAALYTLAGIALYFAADWALTRIETMRGKRFEYRSMIFFVIILVMALGLFQLIQQLMQR